MTPDDELPLASRSGLPDEIAYLRAVHPQIGWRKHPGFGELCDFWLHVHESLRGEGRDLIQVTEAFCEGTLNPGQFQRLFVPRINQFLGHLNGHHQIEDQAYFPRFRALDPRMGAGFDLLQRDHALIHQSLVDLVERAKAMLAALADPGDPRAAVDAYAAAGETLVRLLHQHLADEEEIVIPALLEHGETSLG
jgi:hypothetical protein